MQLPPLLERAAKAIDAVGGRAVLVGGAVRDMVMGREPKDFDIEVYGLSEVSQLETLLSSFGSVSSVGKSFGVLKLHVEEDEYDFAFPRTEKKVAKGHQGFEVVPDGGLDFSTAAKRRDFTVNAIGYDLMSKEILDPYGGLNDIQFGTLRHIDDATFAEDPLRVYRAVQFAARFGFEVAEETAVLCKAMVQQGMLEELPRERVYEEWKKLLLKAPKPSVGLEMMRRWGITERYFPELHALTGVPQDPKWHPEGDVWVHTMLSIDAMASILNREQGAGSREQWNEKEKLKLLFAELCHDFGKPETTTLKFGDGEVIKWVEYKTDKSILPEIQTDTPPSIHAIGHEKAGLAPTGTFMYRLTNEHDFIRSILPLVEHHLKPSQFYKQGAKAGAIRRLATKVNIEELVLVARADFLGRTTPEAKRGEFLAGEWLLERAQALSVRTEPLKPLVQGRDLIACGLIASPKFKAILDTLYAKQLEGAFSDREAALAYVREHFCS